MVSLCRSSVGHIPDPATRVCPGERVGLVGLAGDHTTLIHPHSHRPPLWHIPSALSTPHTAPPHQLPRPQDLHAQVLIHHIDFFFKFHANVFWTFTECSAVTFPLPKYSYQLNKRCTSYIVIWQYDTTTKILHSKTTNLTPVVWEENTHSVILSPDCWEVNSKRP